MEKCCIVCHKQTEDIDQFTGLCYECMEWSIDNFPEYEDDFDSEAEV